MASNYLGQRLSYEGDLCTIRYIGNVANTKGTWLGVEWDDPLRGKHAGTHNGVTYFKCKNEHPTVGSFVRPTRPTDLPVSVTEAIQKKYGRDVSSHNEGVIRISGKQVQEVGFEKIQRQLANLSSLRVVALDGCCVLTSGEVGQLCPNIQELDLSRNLIEDFETVIEIVNQLPALKELKLDGNRFRTTQLIGGSLVVTASSRLVTLSLDSTLLEWNEIAAFASQFPALSSLSASTNQLTSIPAETLPLTITELHLEYNNFSSISDVQPVLFMPNVHTLSLKGNKISSTSLKNSRDMNTKPIMKTFDLAYNEISSWTEVDNLATAFPRMTSLKVYYNPLYGGATTDEDFLETTARLATLTMLNHSKITAKERQNAESFYLSKIARKLASVPPQQEEVILVDHPRYSQLCEMYDKPIVRREPANQFRPGSLGASLVQCTLNVAQDIPLGPKVVSRSITRNIPSSFTIWDVLGLVRRIFGIREPALLQAVVGGKVLKQKMRSLAMLTDTTIVDMDFEWDPERVTQYERTKKEITGT